MNSIKCVFVGGSTVALATLHNQDEVARKDVRPGDTVFVRKAGDVIPEVVAPVESLRPAEAVPWKFPRDCPVCGQLEHRKLGEPLVREPADGLTEGVRQSEPVAEA